MIPFHYLLYLKGEYIIDCQCREFGKYRKSNKTIEQEPAEEKEMLH